MTLLISATKDLVVQDVWQKDNRTHFRLCGPYGLYCNCSSPFPVVAWKQPWMIHKQSGIPVFNKTLFVITGKIWPGSCSLPTLLSFLLGKEKCNHSCPSFSTVVFFCGRVYVCVCVCVCMFALCIILIQQLNNMFIYKWYKCISKSCK